MYELNCYSLSHKSYNEVYKFKTSNIFSSSEYDRLLYENLDQNYCEIHALHAL